MAEKYADKDAVKQREETIGVPVIVESAKLYSGEKISLTKKEKEILTLLSIYQFNKKEVAQYLDISRESLRTHLKNIRRKIPPKES